MPLIPMLLTVEVVGWLKLLSVQTSSRFSRDPASKEKVREDKARNPASFSGFYKLQSYVKVHVHTHIQIRVDG